MLAFISFRSVSLPRFWAISLFGVAAAFLAAPAPAQPAPQEILRPDTMDARVAACTACHGAQGRAGNDGYYPRLAGKPQEYLYHQLLNFRDDRRQYRPMTHLLTGLPDDYLREIAAYFSSQHVPYPPPTRADVSAATLEAGRKLALNGDAARGLPACAACHGAALGGVLPAIPGLLGLPRDYIGSQIGSWKNGLRRAAEPDCMADISNKLTPQDIGALAAWLSSQPVVEPYAPEAAGSIRLPAECGSQAQR
ncbi:MULTISPECIES: c-type cytochrome [Achromobacter]|jgi:cytochrome c553|uniref:Cytochrome C n=1 Tax=Alcaligenes xylosoxydans xylosoxydans TaxID=85698 RepID=A0A424W8Z3_ALCXX|nr:MULTISPECIES: c-type cytochrome [Achromobacter]MBC9905127.1 c-type cytochrome [Achromobacter xylosoxidans]MBD0871419.1 c-type cytochrome [Achromobacter xylosoxidans]MDH1303283.1 c-type cytochrome [Achromobacter sp. GD03932]QNP85628.1 c-type cytochrome [Achromobacter xylosoxidans]RPJ89648.1 cytochrome C [Achromobacter xylosoxidans]